MLKANNNKNYITSDRWCIFNKYKTYLTYGKQTIECTNEINKQIINLTYYDEENNEQHYKDNNRLFLLLPIPIHLVNMFQVYLKIIPVNM